MLIGELSKQTGFSRDTIRFYEKNGLISLDKDDRLDNNYKDYSGRVLKRLMVIKKIKDYGFTLEEIKGMMKLHELGALEQERGRKFVEKKIQKIDKKIEELQQIKAALKEVVCSEDNACIIENILHELDT